MRWGYAEGTEHQPVGCVPYPAARAAALLRDYSPIWQVWNEGDIRGESSVYMEPERYGLALDERIESIEQNAGEKCGRTDRWIAVRAGNVTGFVRGDLVRRVT